MTYSLEELTNALAGEALPLFRDHHNEVTAFPDIKLDPDYDQYKIFSASGMLRCYTARENGTLVGYAFFFVRAAPHYKGSIQAVADILYLAPALRKGFAGPRFIRWCDDQLRAEGVQVVYQNTTVQGKDFGPVLLRMGYKPLEFMYAKRLDTWEDR